MQAKSHHPGWMFWFYKNEYTQEKYIRTWLSHEMESFLKKRAKFFYGLFYVLEIIVRFSLSWMKANMVEV